QVGALRVADREVAGEAVIEALKRKGPHRRDQMFLAVLALFGVRGERWDLREDQARLLGVIDRDALANPVEHGEYLSHSDGFGNCRRAHVHNAIPRRDGEGLSASTTAQHFLPSTAPAPSAGGTGTRAAAAEARGDSRSSAGYGGSRSPRRVGPGRSG